MVLSSLMPVALLAITLGAGINGFFIITCGFFKVRDDLPLFVSRSVLFLPSL